VNVSDTLNPFYFAGCNQASCLLRRFGTTFELSSANSYLSSTSYREDFHARTSALQELERAWKEADQAYFSKSFASLASFDPDSFSWRTSQLSLFGGLTEFSWSSLRWGSIVDGRLYQPQKWEPRIPPHLRTLELSPV
jgi:hypothetical protein